ncbi:LapA family protein [Amycolatopsis sp. YIM 10]|uniref:LapA family protein n=1 Tax=Amycolatopsis sp. YIM 10 TaxID=2653857 RepID=UPI00128FFC87|nr:LapA family protein [Amycolatopsis sp. YIM 10]QFU85859.1 hypothetical protein YIM_03185 [Amycolatopsis sp. YIM 10]
MLWLFGQIWVWLLVAFGLGVLLTWMVLSVVHRKELARAEAEALPSRPFYEDEDPPAAAPAYPAPAYPADDYDDGFTYDERPRNGYAHPEPSAHGHDNDFPREDLDDPYPGHDPYPQSYPGNLHPVDAYPDDGYPQDDYPEEPVRGRQPRQDEIDWPAENAQPAWPTDEDWPPAEPRQRNW